MEDGFEDEEDEEHEVIRSNTLYDTDNFDEMPRHVRAGLSNGL